MKQKLEAVDQFKFRVT